MEQELINNLDLLMNLDSLENEDLWLEVIENQNSDLKDHSQDET